MVGLKSGIKGVQEYVNKFVMFSAQFYEFEQF